MDKETLKKAKELEEKIKDIDGFIYRYEKTWKWGIISRKTVLSVGNVGYGMYGERHIECDRELSEIMYDALIKYQKKIHDEFNNLGGR